MRNLENMLSAKKPDTKEHIVLYDSAYMQMEKGTFLCIVTGNTSAGAGDRGGNRD